VGPRAVVAKYRRRAEGQGALARQRKVDDASFVEVVQAAQLGELVALAVMQEVGRYVGLGIANLVNIFNPELVVLGGLFSQAHETLIPVIKETVKQNSLFPMRTALSVVPSQRGADDGIWGAVALVLDELLRAPV
jgi:predicted NBD/HSP70 family sugar kinase